MDGLVNEIIEPRSRRKADEPRLPSFNARAPFLRPP